MTARIGNGSPSRGARQPEAPQPAVRRAAEALRDAAWLDRVGDPARDAILGLPDRARTELRGRWLGHPLHPVLTDVPIGLWLSSVVLDALGAESLEPAADRLLRYGIAAAVPTAAIGSLDWAESSRPARRQGLAHAVSNVVALALFASSAAARRRDRARGRRLSLVGAVALGVGAYLGGHLAYAEGVGVDPVAAREPADAPAHR